MGILEDLKRMGKKKGEADIPTDLGSETGGLPPALEALKRDAPVIPRDQRDEGSLDPMDRFGRQPPLNPPMRPEPPVEDRGSGHQLELILSKLETIDARLRTIESKLDSQEKRY